MEDEYQYYYYELMDIIENSKELDPDIYEYVNDNFWELL